MLHAPCNGPIDRGSLKTPRVRALVAQRSPFNAAVCARFARKPRRVEERTLRYKGLVRTQTRRVEKRTLRYKERGRMGSGRSG